MRNSKFLGVYSRRDKNNRLARILYFAWRLADGRLAVQELDKAYVAKGEPVVLTAAQFVAIFRLEPSILAAPVKTPDFSQFDIAAEPEKPSAPQQEKVGAARQIEADLRDSFSKAMRALSRPRDRSAAMASLERIAEIKKGIVPEHKNMFRDFGVALRKKDLHRLAIACAARAVELAPADDHARFNLARLLGLAGRFDEADEQLKEALKLDPKEKVYSRLERHLARERQFAAAKSRLT